MQYRVEHRWFYIGNSVMQCTACGQSLCFSVCSVLKSICVIVPWTLELLVISWENWCFCDSLLSDITMKGPPLHRKYAGAYILNLMVLTQAGKFVCSFLHKKSRQRAFGHNGNTHWWIPATGITQLKMKVRCRVSVGTSLSKLFKSNRLMTVSDELLLPEVWDWLLQNSTRLCSPL